MSFRVLFSLCFIAFLGACTTSQPNAQLNTPPTLLIISIDGARYDYLDKFDLPNLQSVANEGLRADFLKPVFPSKTFPNHYSLVTGLRPENHGLVNNSMYDSEYGIVFSMGKREEVENPRWWGGEPIWVTAEKQGVKAATYFFPGSETEIQGHRPSYWFSFDDSHPNRQRIETVISWLAKPQAERPQLITLYFSDVDTAGHLYGPDAPQVKETFEALDKELGYLFDQIKAQKLDQNLHLMIASDHGMQAVDLKNHFPTDSLIDESQVEQVVFSRETISIHPKPGYTKALYEHLTQVVPEEVGTVLLKSDMPKRFEYQNHRRIPEIMLLANPGYIWSNARSLARAEKEGGLNKTVGTHGYDNEHPNMFGMFIAQGPSFKAQSRIAGIEMVDLYQVMTHILKIEPAAHQGNPKVMPQILNEPSVKD